MVQRSNVQDLDTRWNEIRAAWTTELDLDAVAHRKRDLTTPQSEASEDDFLAATPDQPVTLSRTMYDVITVLVVFLLVMIYLELPFFKQVVNVVFTSVLGYPA